MSEYINLSKEQMVALHTDIKNVCIDGEETLRVFKAEKIMQFDENTYARTKNFNFHNGVIEVKMLSRLLPDAPDFARGFIGIAYRINEKDAEFESFYVRPTNGRSCNDPVRRAHGCQYFSFPGYTFAYFREFGIADYEAELDIDLDEWIQLKAVIEDERATFYVNDMENPALIVDEMKHGKGEKGAVGLFVDVGTEAFFKDLKIKALD